MSRAHNFFFPTGLSGSVGAESAKSFTQEYNALLSQSLLCDLPTLVDFDCTATALLVDFPQYTNTTSYSNLPFQANGWALMSAVGAVEKADIVSDIEEVVNRTEPLPPEPSTKRYRTTAPTSTSRSAVHIRPANDAHYPFKAIRKNRTKMQSGVCVWCATEALMALPQRPVLQTRTTGNGADWEQWMRDFRSPQSGFLKLLVDKIMPKNEVVTLVSEDGLQGFYKDMAGALIEAFLRELRANELDEGAIMAQVRSSKHHKTARVAAIIEGAYDSR